MRTSKNKAAQPVQDLGGRIQSSRLFYVNHASIDVAIRQDVAPVSASTTNGSISLKLPGDFSGYIDAKTRNGQVRSNFPIPVTDKSKKRFSGRIGEGMSSNVNLRTKNGSINLRKW